MWAPGRARPSGACAPWRAGASGPFARPASSSASEIRASSSVGAHWVETSSSSRKLPSGWKNQRSLRTGPRQVKARKTLATIRDAVIRSPPAYRSAQYSSAPKIALATRCSRCSTCPFPSESMTHRHLVSRRCAPENQVWRNAPGYPHLWISLCVTSCGAADQEPDNA